VLAGSNPENASTLYISLVSGARNSSSAPGACEEIIRKGARKHQTS
jgi:hypothetical protein